MRAGISSFRFARWSLSRRPYSALPREAGLSVDHTFDQGARWEHVNPHSAPTDLDLRKRAGTSTLAR
jgi:hypothetical protein